MSVFPQANLPEFINSVDEVVENSPKEEEQRILDTYEPTPVHESDSGADNIQDVPVIPYKTALEGLEALRFFRLKNPPCQFTENRAAGRPVISRKKGY